MSTIETMHIAATNTLRKWPRHEDPATVDQNGSTLIISPYNERHPPPPFGATMLPLAECSGSAPLDAAEPDPDPLAADNVAACCPVPRSPVLCTRRIVAE